MPATAVDRLYGLTGAVAIKPPCRCATTGDIDLVGLQTIDGELVEAGDRVLVKDQDDNTENGIYEANTSRWSRARDFNGTRDVVNGTLVVVREGATNDNSIWELQAEDPVVIGTDAVVFGRGLLSSAASMGFTQVGVGAVERTAQSKLRETVTLEDFDAAGDGVEDDTTALTNALATGKRIRLQDGATYKITSAMSTASALRMSGSATILFAFSGVGISCTGPIVDIAGVTFDGNDQCYRAVYGSGQDSVVLKDCTVENIYGTGTGGTGMTTGVRFDGPSRVRITGCEFIKIRALADGIEGNDAGAVRAIYLRDEIGHALIDGCYFEDVNNQTAGAVINNEDADAIQCQAFTAAEDQHVTIQNCHFTNCGKRAAKFQAGSGSVSKFVGNTVVSAWMTPSATVQTANNSKAMYAVVSVYGGTLIYANNTSSGGVIAYMIQANDSAADLGVIHASNNVHAPLFSEIGFTNNYPCRYSIDSTNPRATGHVVDLIESGNYFDGLYARSLMDIRDMVSMGNWDSTQESTFRFDTVRNLSVLGNIQLAAATTTSEYGYQFITNAFDAACFTGNVMSGFYDAVYFGSALNGGTYKVTFTGGVFTDQVRNDVSELTQAADKANYSYVGINTSKATNALHTLRGVTTTSATAGAATALPATPEAYETVTINAITYKRPLYL